MQENVRGPKGGLLSYLAEPRRPRDDFTHFFRSDFVAAEPEKFTRDALNLVHAQTKRHQLGTERHEASAHQPGEAAVVARGRDRSLCTGNLVDQSLDLVGRTRVAEETENDDDGFLSDNAIDAGLRGQLSNQFVHITPPSTGLLPGRSLGIDLERLRPEIQAISACKADFDLDRVASVAALQEWASESRYVVAPHHRFSLGVGEKYENGVFETANCNDRRGRFQSTGGMRYDGVAWRPNLPDAREEAI